MLSLRTNNTYRDTKQTTNTQLRSKIVLMRSISFHQLKSQKCELIDNHHHFISTYNHNNLGAAIIWQVGGKNKLLQKLGHLESKNSWSVVNLQLI